MKNSTLLKNQQGRWIMAKKAKKKGAAPAKATKPSPKKKGY